MEILGPNGSGKTYFEATVLRERIVARQSGVVLIATKPVDRTIRMLGLPIVDTWQGVQKHDQVIFWPRTARIGRDRELYQEAKIRELLHRLWVPGANTIVAFDEIAYAESLRTREGEQELRRLIQMYLREGRSQGITVLAMKQRPQGVSRDMHSESIWTAAFKPKDRADAERVAELFGRKQDWVPILESLDRSRHEFVIKHLLTDRAYISWVDVPLKPLRTKQRNPYGN